MLADTNGGAGVAEAGYNASATVATLYVATSGSDSNPGTQAAPLASIAKAASLAGPGTTVVVAPGRYPGGILTTASGTATARIRYVSSTRGGAVLVPPASSGSAIGWENRGAYVDIEGFEVDGSAFQAGTRWTTGIHASGSYDVLRNNHVHHIASSGACSAGGGIGADSYYGGVAIDVLANAVHDIGAPGCMTMYGIYSYAANSDVKNNLVHGVSYAGVRLWRDAAHDNVINNTIFAVHTGIVVGGGEPYQGGTLNDYTRVANNIVYDTVYGVIELGAVGAHNSYANNLMSKQSAYPYLLFGGAVASATVAAGPGFVNYVRAGGGDYRLAALSPAIDAGAALEAPATDFSGAARPSGAAFDIGAYEYAAGPAPTPAPSPAPAPGPAPAPSPVPNTPYHLYVASSGSDSAAGTQAAPLKTIARAAALAKPGTTVHVAPGTYPGGFKTTASGTASARIYYVSTTRWGARIVPPASSSNDSAWDNRGNYVDIVGFEIDGSARQGGTAWLHGVYNGGSYDAIRNNHVHHIATAVPCNGAGGSAIGVDSYYHGVKGDVIGNLVHDIGPAGCSYVQGIYMSTSGSVQSNVVYRVAEAGIHLWHDATDVIIANNTVVNSHTGIIVGGGDFYFTSAGADNTHVVNNIVYDNVYGISEQGKTGTHNTYSSNLVYQNSSYNFSLRNGLKATATVSADPQFVAYSRTGTPDLHLRSTSPARGTGTTSYAPATDIDGAARSPVGMGAYQ
ncbi:choice-of-anchor Q domain-containing protein [Oxalobacteraceae bacterium A2-2]